MADVRLPRLRPVGDREFPDPAQLEIDEKVIVPVG